MGEIKDIKDIKDKTPNDDLVRHIEGLLKYAKSGEMRTLVYAMGWDDDSVTSSWVIDKRTGSRRIVGEIEVLKSNVVTLINLQDPESILSKGLND